MNKGRETVTFEVKKAYLQNGYLYIKDKLRHHFPKPDAQITLLQPGHAGELTRTVKLVIPDRWRIVGLGDWFTSNDVKAGDKVVLEVVESRQTYRIRRVPTGEDA